MQVLDDVVQLVEALTGPRVLVAVDGPDAAGKTTFARRLVRLVRRPVVLASVDDWHHPRAVRVRRGALSPEGYYRDAFDFQGLTAQLLEPFAGGAPLVRLKAFDHLTDTPLPMEPVDVAAEAVLVVEGVFLLRPELRRRWDLALHLHVSDDVVLARARERDLPLLGSAAAVEQRYRARYLPGQALYRQDAQPLAAADVVLDNTDPDHPLVLQWQP